MPYLFGANEYVKYSSSDYRYVDPGYPKETATYLRDEPAFAFMSKEFQQHLDKMEADAYTPFFNGIVDNGRCLYFFTQDTLFAGGSDKYVEYAIDGLGSVDNNFTSGEFVDAAFVDIENEQTYLFSGEQYIRYTGDNYRYIDQGYPKIISESLADDLGIDSLPEEYCDGIDAAFYISSTNTVFFNERRYLNINSDEILEGNINDVWGKIDNTFIDTDENTIDGAYVDMNGALHIFKGQQFVRYSDTKELFALNPYNESRYVDEEYPLYITDQWPQIDTNILVDEGVDTVFKFENEIHFHTDGLFVTYDLDLDDHDDEVDLQVLVYRWGEWSDYLLSDIHALSRFKDLGQRFTGSDITLTELVSGANGEVKEPFMHFAAIFGFEKEEVRWLKQRNAFLADRVNVFEEEFQVELVLRLYDILSTTQRIRVDVSALYNDVWLNLYGSSVDYAAAASNVYDLLVSVDCNNNYETLVKQIDNELNTIKRDALVPYVIANDDEVTTTRGLYQKLLIDIQMGSCAETSRIKEATAAVQLYLHRYFVNLENIDLDSSDQEAAREVCKDRWKWLQNYRVWEANRKVFLYPENYIRPELRDTKTPSFEALEQSLSQGELTEDTVEEAYYAYLDAFTEVSELTIAGGYVYDEPDSSDKKLLLFGRTRTDPMRYFYRFGTFVGGDSDAAIWDAWLALDIPIEATRVEPVFAFNRVFVFWTTIEESSEDPSSAEVKTTSTDDKTQTVSSEGNSQFEVKIFYSFYNLNKRWTQPQALQTEFNGSSKLITSYSYEDLDLFVENSTKLTQNSNDHEYENIYIGLRMYVGTVTYPSIPTPVSIPIYKYAAYNLTPELYSQEADTQTIDNRGQDLFTELFNEGSIEEDNVVMLNYNANSVDGPWFAYNHNGCGFLVKPDTISLSNDIELEVISSDDTMLMSGINAAVQVIDGGDVIYFLDNQTYVTRSSDGTFSDSEAIGSRWGIAATSEMQISGTVDSAFAFGSAVFLSLDEQIYQYKNTSFSELVSEPKALSSLITFLPDTWSSIDAAFKNVNNIVFWFNNETGTVLSSDNFNTPAQEIESVFGVSQVDAAFIGKGSLGTSDSLYLFLGNKYYRYTPDDTTGEFASSPDTDFPKLISENDEGFPNWSSVDAAFTASDGVSYLFNNANQLYYRSDTSEVETTVDIWGVVSHTALQTEQVVNAAYSIDGNLYLIAGNEYYRYSLGSDSSIPNYIDSDYPKTLPDSVVQLNETLDAAFVLNNQLYFFSGDEYYQLDEGVFDPGELTSASPITGSWGNLPQDIRSSGLSAAFNYTEIDSTDDSITNEKLYLIQDDSYIDYNLLSDSTAIPYEINNVNYEVIRLSSSTAEQLNQIVFAGEIDDLLKVPTQEINESPTISFESSSPDPLCQNSCRL